MQGPRRERAAAWSTFAGKTHVLLSTYDAVRADAGGLDSLHFDLIVLDEIQRIKNRSSATAQAVRRLTAARRWGLTGTPLENRIVEFATVLEAIGASAFTAAQRVGAISADQIRERARPYVLRRRKEDALPELPPKAVDTKWLELAEKQRAAYEQAEAGAVRQLSGERIRVGHMLGRIQELKQRCNFDPATGTSAKLDFLKQEYLPQACRDIRKVLLFSQYVPTLQRLMR